MSSIISFVNVGLNLAKELNPHTGNNFVFPQGNSDSMFLIGVCERDVLEVVRKLKNGTSNDCNMIDMSLIFVTNPFLSGIFLDKMKMAKVVPIYINGDKHIISNYRPVSLLPQFSKILEKLFANRLDNFIEMYDLLNDHQYGCRSNSLTSWNVNKIWWC